MRLQGNDADWLINELATVESEQEGLAEELNGARATLVNLEREQDGLAAERSLLRNDVTKMVDELISVGAECNNVVRELSGEQDCLINKVLSLRNDATELVDKPARIAGRTGWEAELNGTRATLADQEGGRRSCGHRR